MFKFRRLASIAASFALVPVAAGAQPLGKVVLTPYAGVYAPLGKVAEYRAVEPDVSLAANAEHQLGFALGANASYWFTPRMGIEAGGLYAWSDVKTAFNAVEQGQLESFSEKNNAALILATTKFMVGVFPPTSDFQLRLGVGPAIIHRLGSAYKADEEGKITGRTDFGGAVSLCTKIPLGAGVALRLRAEDYMYQAKLAYKDKLDPSDSFNFDKKFQHDFVLSAGLQIGLMK
jgi:hypothetical protein